MIVTRMQHAQTHLEVITAIATLDLLEMDILAQVSNNQYQTYINFEYLVMYASVIFLDDDECVAELDNCHENATCNNTFGSFECTCIAGFDGDGVNCTSKAVDYE